jgi:hypothetical protein
MHTPFHFSKNARTSACFMKAWFACSALGVAALTIGCGQAELPVGGQRSSQAPAVETTTRESAAPGSQVATFSLTTASDAWCPKGFAFNATHRLCESATLALGPFPAALVANCQKFGGGKSCLEANWDRTFARNLRGTMQCPEGTWLDASLGECSDGTRVYGPFARMKVDACQKKGGGAVCETMRWHASFVTPTGNAPRATWNKKTLNYYSTKANYERVTANVFSWFGTRTNGCVAFMSTALRQVGFPIPQNAVLDGYSVSTWTASFSAFLRNKGWVRVNSHTELQPGDIVFTVGEESDPTNTPLHTYMFHSWKDRAAKTGWVIDNQAFTHERAIFSYGDFNFSPFAYALRSQD